MLKALIQKLRVPPGAGRKKVLHPREVLRGWIVSLLVVALIGTLLWSRGLGQAVGQMQREVMAVGYLRAAQRLAVAQPVQRDQALAALARAHQLAPDLPSLAETAVTLYVSLRAYEEALNWLQTQREPDLMTRVNLGQCLLLSGQEAQGLEVLEGAVQEALLQVNSRQLPKQVYALVLNNVGYVYAVAGRHLERAREYIEVAANLEPLQPAYADSLGWILYRGGDYRSAAFYLERAIRLQLPAENAEMYYHLGAVYARLGRIQDARRVLLRSLELDPSWEEAQHELRNLGQSLPPPVLACRPLPSEG
jgi:tetratricopeptide (TPR) repeat protein